jgi:hypothetical protein
MNDKPIPNLGIQVFGGSISANSMAVGPGATINSTGSHSATIDKFISEMRSAIAKSALASADAGMALDAVGVIEGEAAKAEPNMDQIKSALGVLERIAEVAGGMVNALQRFQSITGIFGG